MVEPVETAHARGARRSGTPRRPLLLGRHPATGRLLAIGIFDQELVEQVPAAAPVRFLVGIDRRDRRVLAGLALEPGPKDSSYAGVSAGLTGSAARLVGAAVTGGAAVTSGAASGLLGHRLRGSCGNGRPECAPLPGLDALPLRGRASGVAVAVAVSVAVAVASPRPLAGIRLNTTPRRRASTAASRWAAPASCSLEVLPCQVTTTAPSVCCASSAASVTGRSGGESMMIVS